MVSLDMKVKDVDRSLTEYRTMKVYLSDMNYEIVNTIRTESHI